MTLSPREIASDLLQEAEIRGKQYSVPAGLHSDDFIFWFIHDQAHMVDKRQAVEDYFRSGQEGAAFIRDLLKEWRPRLLLDALQTPGQPLTMLEFASGYGRVTRHFPSVMEDYKVTACDIHEQAVGFLRGMGLDAEQSSSVPEDLQLGRQFDVIYAFSFFTHMPRRTWQRWLAALGRHVKPGGLLLFSTHGRLSQEMMQVRELEADGFFFRPASEQADLPVAEYGNTVTTFEFVAAQLQDMDLRIVQFREAGAGHHDFYILQRYTEQAVHEPTEAQRLREQIAQMHRSTSWSVTAPLRALGRALGRGSRP